MHNNSIIYIFSFSIKINRQCRFVVKFSLEILHLSIE